MRAPKREREREREREEREIERQRRERGLSNEYFIYEVERINYHKKRGIHEVYTLEY